MAGEAAHMHFVNDLSRRWPFQRRITFPVVRRGVHHDALHRRRGIVAFLAGGVTTIPCRHHHPAAIRIEQDFILVEARSLPWIVRAASAISVDLSWLNTRYEDMPIVIGAVG